MGSGNGRGLAEGPGLPIIVLPPGKDEHVQKAVQELPDKIDHNEHAALLEKFGLDPGKLAEKAAERGLSSL